MIVAQKQQEGLVEALFQALINDGFTAYCCGPEGDPTALIVFYEWDDHVDVVTIPQTGPAAAARLVKPAEVLDPPPTAVWTWVGEPEPAIWALLKLAHPDDPDAPAEVVQTPEALRVPPELQRPVSIRMPPAGKAGVRAERLRQAQAKKDISREFFGDLFEQVDSAAAIGAAENFTSDAEFQFANYPPMVGPAAIAQFVTTLFSLAAMVRHELYNFWELADRTAFTNGMVTFTRHDFTKLVVPFATVSKFNEDHTLLIRHQVYVDASALVPASAPSPL
jgi:hypothetical protein